MSANDLQRKIAAHNVRKRWARELRMLEMRRSGKFVVPTNKRIKEGIPESQNRRFERFNDRDITEDPRQLSIDIARRRNALAKQSPVDLNRKDREKVERQMAKDRTWIKKRMISKRDNNLKPGHPDFSEAVTRCEREHSGEFKGVVNRYKNAMRQLDPDDPMSASIEKLRK